MAHTRKRNRRSEVPTNLPMIAGVRISFSRDEQTSTASQLAAIRSYCESHSHTLVGHYIEDGVSAYNRKAARPDLERALQAIERGDARGLIVWKLDRLVRDLAQFMEIWNRIEKAGGYFISVTEQFDTSQPMGRLMMMVVAAFAEMESDMKRVRMEAWNDTRIVGEEAAKHGGALPPGGPRPFGYERDARNSLAIIPQEAAVIVEAVAAILDGSSLREINRTMQAVAMDDVPTTTRGLRKMLCSPTIAGLRAFEDDFVKGNWQPIVDRENWEAVRTILRDPARKSAKDSNQHAYLLSGFLTCDACSVKMLTKTHPEGRRYMCPQCNSSLPLAFVETFVSDYIVENVNADAWQGLRERGRAFNPAVLADIEADRLLVNEMFDAGEMNRDDYRARIRGINARLAGAQESTPLHLPNVDDLQAAWATLTLDDKRLVIRALFESVSISRWEGKPHYDKSTRIHVKVT